MWKYRGYETEDMSKYQWLTLGQLLIIFFSFMLSVLANISM